MDDSLLIPKALGEWWVLIVHVFKHELVLLTAVYIEEKGTFDDKAHA